MLKQIVIGILIASVVATIGIGWVMRFVVPAPVATNGPANGNPFRRGGQGQGLGAAAANVQMTTVQGTVASGDRYAMTVQTSTGETITVQGRPWTFALEQKFAAQAGDPVKLNGFYQNGQFEVATLQNLANNSTAQVRDQYGRSGWAGRGNGGAGYNPTTN